MRVIDFDNRYSSPISLALGFFDCMHVGHRALVGRTVSGAKELGVESAVLTFRNDLSGYFGGEKQIYCFDERLLALADVGVDNVIAMNFGSREENLSAEEFFCELVARFDIREIYIGADYTFGKGALGNADMLKKLCEERGIALNIVPYATIDGKKISASELKKLVAEGDIPRLNARLGAPYIILGKIASNRKVGRSLGFPTANIPMREDKLPLRDGIYATTITVDGQTLRAMTNIGAKPTFDDAVPTIETYIFDFDGDLYGKEALLRVYARTREIKKFASPHELSEQLERDEREIKRILGEILG